MPRRVSLPGASELFRSTDRSGEEESTDPRPPPGSGRVRPEEKITVYVSSDELLALEQARLTLRARHGMAVDRGRIVREAMSAIFGRFLRARPRFRSWSNACRLARNPLQP